jgi:hypothetical protein
MRSTKLKRHTHTTRGVLAVERSAGEFLLRPDGLDGAEGLIFL